MVSINIADKRVVIKFNSKKEARMFYNELKIKNSKKKRRTGVQDSVLKIINKSNEPISNVYIKDTLLAEYEIDITLQSLSPILTTLKKQGRIFSPSRTMYCTEKVLNSTNKSNYVKEHKIGGYEGKLTFIKSLGLKNFGDAVNHFGSHKILNEQFKIWLKS